jgi:glycosyltransferase involved in cell wall biosynthesis
VLASVVVRTKDEAARLRLTLASLERQTARFEVVVVNDGSSDATPEVIADAARRLPLRAVTHATAHGRSAASNAGARAATGEVLLFLDGDTLAAPDLVERQLAVHADGRPRIGRGENLHLRCTRFLEDPESGTPRPGEASRLAKLAPGELDRLRVTRAQVVDRFADIDRRAEPGNYPGAGPRRLQELEIDALRHHPSCTVLWAASAGANLSVRRDAFRDAGGFDEELDNNEHRELALRLVERGAAMAFAEGARSYHLTHRVGWRDPLVESAWEPVFWRAHPLPAVKLLAVFWACLGAAERIPPEARIQSLPELEAAARGDRNVDYDAIRRLIGNLPELDAPPDGRTLADASPRSGGSARAT